MERDVLGEADEEELEEREQTTNVDDTDIDEYGVALDVTNGEDG